MKRQYYYLISSIPEADFNPESNTMDFFHCKEYVLEQIHANDTSWVKTLFYPIDNRNLLNFLYSSTDFTWELGGSISKLEIEDALHTENPQLPRYMVSFLQERNEAELNNQSFDLLTGERLLNNLFYSEVEKSKNKFISEWFRFDREVRNIQAAFAARKLQLDVEKILTNSDDITEQLLNSKATEFGLSKERDYIPELFQIFAVENLLERENKLDLFRWKYIDELITFEYFSLDAVLAFLQKCYLLHRWSKMDYNQGKERFKNLVQELRDTYKQ